MNPLSGWHENKANCFGVFSIQPIITKIKMYSLGYCRWWKEAPCLEKFDWQNTVSVISRDELCHSIFSRWMASWPVGLFFCILFGGFWPSCYFYACTIWCTWDVLGSRLTSVREQCFTRKGIFHVTWLILPYLEHNSYLHKIVYSSWANRWWSRWDTTDAAVESDHSGDFPLHNNIDSFCASEIVTWISQSSASIARVWQMLCSVHRFPQILLERLAES
jgi:hypothetical protein